MSQDDVSTPVAAAVFVGSAILVGAPVTYVVLAVLLNVVFFALEVFGVSFALSGGPLAAALFVVSLASAAWLWMRISYEVAHFRLYGVAALSRGSRVGTAVRYLAFWTVGLVAAALVLIVGVFSALALLSSRPLVGLTGVISTLAVLWVLARAARSFWDGFTSAAR